MAKSLRPEPSYLYPDEKELARVVLGPPRAAVWPGVAGVWEKAGLPRIDPLTGGRYWPAVQAFLDRRYSLNVPGSAVAVADGVENPLCPYLSVKRLLPGNKLRSTLRSDLAHREAKASLG